VRCCVTLRPHMLHMILAIFSPPFFYVCVLLFMVCGGLCGDCVFWWGFGGVLDVVYGVFYLLGFVDGCVEGVV